MMKLRTLAPLVIAWLAIARVGNGQTTKTAATQPATITVVHLTLHPSRITSPALKYELLPPMSDMRPGDAAYNYQLAERTLPSSRTSDKKFVELFERVQDSNRAAFSVTDATAMLERIGVEHIHEAARCEDARWDSNYRNNGIATLLPFLNDMRESANVVCIEGRVALAKSDFARADYCMQTEFSMIRQLNHDPFLVQGLVGVGIGVLALETNVEDWIVDGPSPNLFWALGNLPNSMINLSEIERVERSQLAFTDKPFLGEAMDGTLPDEQWPQVIHFLVGWQHLRETHSNDMVPGPDLMVDKEMAAAVAADLPAARKYLQTTGLTATQAAAVPDMKAVGTYWLAEFRIQSDEQWKGWTLPYPQAEREILSAEKRMASSESAVRNPLNLFNGRLLRARFAMQNLDRRIALLRIVEALRDYAAQHDRQPPAALDQINDLPIPSDPITGKPFSYRVENNIAIIEAAAPAALSPSAGRRYELTFVR